MSPLTDGQELFADYADFDIGYVERLVEQIEIAARAALACDDLEPAERHLAEAALAAVGRWRAEAGR